MNLFEETQKNFAVLGVCSNQPRINGKSVLTCLIYGTGTSFSVLFLICNASNFQEYTNNLYITTALAVGFFCYTNIIFKMEKMFTLMENAKENIEEKSENPTSKAIYQRTSRFVEKLSRIVYYAIAIVTPVGTIFPKVIISYFVYFTTYLSDEAFELPLLYWFPFDWRNPLGYFVAVVIEYITLGNHHRLLACAIEFGAGLFFFALSGIKDMKSGLMTINDNAKIPKIQSKALEQISEFVEFHSTYKRYVDDFLDIYQPIFMIIYVWSLVTICGVMLLIQTEIQGNGSLALVLATIFYISYAIGIVLVICELGQRLTDAFEGIEQEIKGFEWNLFPLEIQKMLPFILIAAQQPVELRCFGSTSGLRETFKIVVNSAFSYFTVIRQFLK